MQFNPFPDRETGSLIVVFSRIEVDELSREHTSVRNPGASRCRCAFALRLKGMTEVRFSSPLHPMQALARCPPFDNEFCGCLIEMHVDNFKDVGDEDLTLRSPLTFDRSVRNCAT